MAKEAGCVISLKAITTKKMTENFTSDLAQHSRKKELEDDAKDKKKEEKEIAMLHQNSRPIESTIPRLSSQCSRISV